MDAGSGGLLDHARGCNQPGVFCPGFISLRPARTAVPVPATDPAAGISPPVPLDDRFPGRIDPGAPDAPPSPNRSGRSARMADCQPGLGANLLAGVNPDLYGGGCVNAIRLFGVYLRINVLGELAYRVNFYLQLFQSVVELATALAGLAVVFSFTSSLHGWSSNEMLVLIRVYFIAGAALRPWY